MDSDAAKTHHVPYRLYVGVWAALVTLTLITVGASYADLGHIAIFTALLIATVKGSLVILYFMHIRFEKPFFGIMILVLLVTYGIYIGLTFADYYYR